ncbi:hypothetical protein Tco_0875890 [Tanacetum coccineum]|uniref:Uncharacterized protein n=1 Tax=Tanacetum coccineum TaxID=301880 RepID=A0ABQ5BWF1_9ASTR
MPKGSMTRAMLLSWARETNSGSVQMKGSKAKLYQIHFKGSCNGSMSKGSISKIALAFILRNIGVQTFQEYFSNDTRGRSLLTDLEVAFRKHSCYARDTDGVELLKGSCGSNFNQHYLFEDIMKVLPNCLLSKAIQAQIMVMASAFKSLELRTHPMNLAQEKEGALSEDYLD